MAKDILYTIYVSHYSEFARWCLIATEKEFEEYPAVPAAHMVMFPSKPSDGTSVPFMRLKNGKWLTDSWSIAKYCFPDEKIDPEIKSIVNKDIGKGARSLVYEHILGTDGFNQALYGATPFQSWFWWFVHIPASAVMWRTLVRSEKYRADARKRIAKDIPILEKHLGLDGPEDSWDYEITATKLAICGVFAPLLHPKHYALGSGISLPPLEETPEGFQKMVLGYRSTNLGKFIMEFYKRNRVPKAYRESKY